MDPTVVLKTMGARKGTWWFILATLSYRLFFLGPINLYIMTFRNIGKLETETRCSELLTPFPYFLWVKKRSHQHLWMWHSNSKMKLCVLVVNCDSNSSFPPFCSQVASWYDTLQKHFKAYCLKILKHICYTLVSKNLDFYIMCQYL